MTRISSLFLLLLLFASLCCCERVLREFEVPERRSGSMFSFGFLQGGSARVRIESSSATAQLAFLLCSDKDHFKLSYVCSTLEANGSRLFEPDDGSNGSNGTAPTSTGVSASTTAFVAPTPSQATTSSQLCQSMSLFSGSLAVDLTPLEAGTFYFNLANCNPVAIANVSFWAHAVNPGGEELSAAVIPMPIMWSVVTLLWMGTLIFGVGDAIRLRAFGTSARAALLALASLKIGASLMAAAEVEHRSINGSPDETIQLVANLLAALLRGTTLALAVGFARGWLLLARAPDKPIIIVGLFGAIFASTLAASLLKTGLFQLGIEFLSLMLLIGSCMFAVRSVNYTLMRLAQWVPTTVRRRVPGAVSGSETDSDAPLEENNNDENNNNENNENNENDNEVRDGAVAAAAAPVPAPRRRRHIPAAVEWIEVRPHERRAVLVRTAVFLMVRRSLMMLLGGSGVVLGASLLLSQTDDTWLVATVTELWLMLVFFELWTAFRLIKSNIFEPAPLPAGADVDALVAAAEREQREQREQFPGAVAAARR
jgi:hypothetical protein